MNGTQPEIEETLHLLSDTPRRITAAAEALGDDRLHLKPDKKTWSANDNLAHLRACADVWGETIAAMLREDEPTLEHIHPREWMKKTDYPKLPFRESFQSFIDQRRLMLQVLYDLELEEWSRGVTIKNRRHTVFSQARRMALHEAIHNEQIEALVQLL